MILTTVAIGTACVAGGAAVGRANGKHVKKQKTVGDRTKKHWFSRKSVKKDPNIVDASDIQTMFEKYGISVGTLNDLTIVNWNFINKQNKFWGNHMKKSTNEALAALNTLQNLEIWNDKNVNTAEFERMNVRSVMEQIIAMFSEIVLKTSFQNKAHAARSLFDTIKFLEGYEEHIVALDPSYWTPYVNKMVANAAKYRSVISSNNYNLMNELDATFKSLQFEIDQKVSMYPAHVEKKNGHKKYEEIMNGLNDEYNLALNQWHDEIPSEFYDFCQSFVTYVNGIQSLDDSWYSEQRKLTSITNDYTTTIEQLKLEGKLAMFKAQTLNENNSLELDNSQNV